MEENDASARDTPQACKAFKFWTDMYANYGIDAESNFFTRVRTGTRWNTANVNAFFSLPWDQRHAQIIRAQMKNAQEQLIVPGGYFTGRHIVNAWNSVVINNANVRGMLEKAVKDINKELENKRKEVGIE